MVNFNSDQIISMTELQKLSLKKLRKMKLPLYVLDRKSEEGGFAITHLEAAPPSTKLSISHKKAKLPLSRFDFKGRGLFWDRPSLSNHRFTQILQNPDDPEFPWASTRVLERLRSAEALKLFTWDQIRDLLKKSNLRHFAKKPWEHALAYYDQKTQRHR